LVLRNSLRERRSDVKDVGASRGGFGPTGVVFEVGGCERHAAGRIGSGFLQHGADRALARERADGGAHAVSSVEKLQNAVDADKSRTAGYQDLFVTHASLFSKCSGWRMPDGAMWYD